MRYAKAIAGALAAGLVTLKSAVGDDVVTTTEWIDVALAVLGTFGVVWVVPNKVVYDPKHDT